mgnify:CR=1 FL=1
MPCLDLDYAIKDAVQARYAHQNMATLTFTINIADNANNNEGENFVMVFSNDRDELRTKSCRIPHAVKNTAGIGTSQVRVSTG